MNNQMIECPHCKGTKMEEPDCGECGGQGHVDDPDGGDTDTMACPECGGKSCSICDGVGYLSSHHELILTSGKPRIDFVACPNHDTNSGWNKLFFLGAKTVKCNLCKKEFSLEEIKQLIVADYHHNLQNLQRDYAQKLAQLQYMGERISHGRDDE